MAKIQNNPEACADQSKSGNEGSRIKLIMWKPVGLWSYDYKIESCAICRNLIMDTCVDCQHGDNDADLGECTVAWGQCDHAFHSHCIGRWLKAKPVCPLDSSVWKYKDEAGAQ
ncbi:hypothetical protein EDEG_00433 [Edhazardia aedis USNM 41457]|uniref:RING-type domain-containing protein n=1 Tax=Edhazardia aedis (strain USNM 41457) TaxID=1003232 RepID=J9D1R5_EDHAE|nr:hypothetical protein EDEG_00433 [Edhazardia aedis USNM 41457]|eukprot:EJW01519.1 hypothetical protein EDEG_00433 [Edhazardia aedis USNM 41457]